MVGQICTQTWFMSSLDARDAAAGAHPADRLEAVGDGPLDVRQAGDLALVVAHDDDLAHLRQRDEAPVLGVVAGDALVEQDVLGRLEPGHVERREAPEVEPAADHRVHPAHEAVLDEAPLARAEGEVGDRAVPRRGSSRPPPAAPRG